MNLRPLANYTKRTHEENTHLVSLLILLVVVFFLGLYPILRYRGLWGETDTSAFTSALRALLDANRLVPPSDVYPNGYGYQALAVWLIRVSGIRLDALQIYASMVLAVWLVIPAWLLYRKLIDSWQGAILAVVLLFVQPEFLFPALRGTHEKFTRGLMLLALYMLVRSLEARHLPQRYTAWILAFYLSIYALITFNNLLASSFIAATLLSLCLLWLFLRLSHFKSLHTALLLQRLQYAFVIPIVLVFLFVFYVYPPATHNLQTFGTIWERLAVLFLNVEQTASNPYGVVTIAWISLPVYFVMSLANWLLLLSSALIWLVYSLRWLWGRWRPDTYGVLLLWAFYGAFALIGAWSILVDVSGAIAANLQHRMFPSFVMLAAPLLAWWLANHRPRRRWQRRMVHGVLGVTICALAILAVFKATNEPLLSNKWLFYIPAEARALSWAEENLTDRLLWTEYDERLHAATTIRRGGMPLHIRFDHFAIDPGTRDFLISDVTRARSQRLNVPLPGAGDSLITYDNGAVQIHHLRPRTPFQP